MKCPNGCLFKSQIDNSKETVNTGSFSSQYSSRSYSFFSLSLAESQMKSHSLRLGISHWGNDGYAQKPESLAPSAQLFDGSLGAVTWRHPNLGCGWGAAGHAGAWALTASCSIMPTEGTSSADLSAANCPPAALCPPLCWSSLTEPTAASYLHGK